MIDLPLACMSEDIGHKIGASVGIVEAVDTDARGMGWGAYLRVKIRMDLAKPLQRGWKINIEGKSHWISFQYERLPKFCFQCGVICHGKSGCPKRSNFRQQETNQYGWWLRAPFPTKRAERSNRPPIKNSQHNLASTIAEGRVHNETRGGRQIGEKRRQKNGDDGYTANSGGGSMQAGS
jgi:hypothetical protein